MSGIIIRIKVGDPILFNESERFYPLLYNNLKGRLVGMEAISKDEMQFTVAVPIIASELSVLHYDGLEYLDFRDGETYLRFSVKKAKDRDGEDVGEDCIVPFQVAYAVSVHKAQGLEYSSVKLIITKDVEGAHYSQCVLYGNNEGARKTSYLLVA